MVRDVVVLVAPLAGAAERDADRMHRVADALVARSAATWFWKPAFLNSSGDERARRLAGVTGRRERVADSWCSDGSRPRTSPTRGPGAFSTSPMFSPAQRDRVAGRAVVPVRLGVAGQRVAALAVRRSGRRSARSRSRSTGCSPRARCRRCRCRRTTRLIAPGRGRPERRPVAVVAHREVLGVVPQPGDGVAVVVVHHLLRGRRPCRTGVVAAAGADALDEVVHLAAVEGLLLVGVVVVLIAGELAAGAAGETGRARVEPLRAATVGVGRQQVRAVAQARRQRRGSSPAAARRPPGCPARRVNVWPSVFAAFGYVPK